MTEELRLDVKDFAPMSEIHDDDRFMMTQAANAHFAASMPFKTFKEKVLAPIIENSKPNGMGCEIFGSIDEYNALTDLDPKTMYVIIEEGKITQAFLGEYPFSVGGGGDIGGIPIEQVFVDLDALILELGENKQLTATYEPSDATNTTMSWSTSNRLVATVTNGLVTSVGKGECVIKVKARSGAFAECGITIEITLVGLSFSSENNKLVSGYTTQLEPVATPENATLALTYSSSDTSKATVDATTGVVTPVTSSGVVTISAVNKNGVRASISMKIVPFAVSVSCQGIDKTDNSVSNIFSKWQLTKKGAPTHYKYSETVKENGVESTLQSVDWTPMPADGIVDIELYAEFGYKYINWTFKNADGSFEDIVVVPVFYKEPDLITYNFDIDVQCTQEEAQAMSMEIPYYKYNKKFVYNLRADDNAPHLWRIFHRFCNRDKMRRLVRAYEVANSIQDAFSKEESKRPPRRLFYTDGCGTPILFVFDNASMVRDSLGEISFENGQIAVVQTEDIKLAKDYGGHLLLHNMAFFESDLIKPKYLNDYSYPLQRDRQLIFDKFGYTSITYCNPDGDPFYTQPCIKDPKTLLMSGGGYAFSKYSALLNTNYLDRFGAEVLKHYGLPDHRMSYDSNSDMSKVPLSEIRNTLNVSYVYSNNHPCYGMVWKQQWANALRGNPTISTELSHGMAYEINGDDSLASDETRALFKRDLDFFEEIFDIVGGNGADSIWFCSADESIEYMYYQRVAQITKTLTPTGCRFSINIRIPDYLSFKTYSVLIKKLPESAVITRGQGVTAFNKNMKTGLINFGYSTDITERASRYIQKYLSNPTVDNLDRAWYFVKQLGEMQTPYASLLPAFNECPVLSNIQYNNLITNNVLAVKTTNSNKEFGEANYFDISTTEIFSDITSYEIPTGQHKWFIAEDSTCLDNDFNVILPLLFNVQQSLYVRLRNAYGVSSSKSINVTIQRTSGTNDPMFIADPVLKFKYENKVAFSLQHSFVSEFRYKIGNQPWSDWQGLVDEILISMSIGLHTVLFEARNNLNEVVTQSISLNYTGKQRVVLFANINSGQNVDGVGFVNKCTSCNTTCDKVYDIDGVQIGVNQGLYYNIYKTQIDALRIKWNLVGECSFASAYWTIPSLIKEDGTYPNILITNNNNKSVNMYGNIFDTPSYQNVRYYTGFPAGTYYVRLLLSVKGGDVANYIYPNILRVQNQTLKLTEANRVDSFDNNKIWYEFNDVIVDADGYVIISQYPETKFTGMYKLVPIVLIEMTKI